MQEVSNEMEDVFDPGEPVREQVQIQLPDRLLGTVSSAGPYRHRKSVNINKCR